MTDGDLTELLRRHAPLHVDEDRLADARAGLDAGVGLGAKGGAGPRGVARRSPRATRATRIIRVAMPVAAALALGAGFVLWPSPALPSAFADWSPTPQQDLTVAQSELAILQCEVQTALAAAQHQAQLEAAEAEEAVEAGESVPNLEEETERAGLVDTRGSWTLVVLTGADGSESQIGCLVNSAGGGSGGISPLVEWSTDEPGERGDAPSSDALSAYRVSNSAGWSGVTGTAPARTERVVIRMDDGTTVEATVSETTSPVGGRGDPVTPPRSFAAWWPTTSQGPSPTALELHGEDGTVTVQEVAG